MWTPLGRRCTSTLLISVRSNSAHWCLPSIIMFFFSSAGSKRCINLIPLKLHEKDPKFIKEKLVRKASGWFVWCYYRHLISISSRIYSEKAVTTVKQILQRENEIIMWLLWEMFCAFTQINLATCLVRMSVRQRHFTILPVSYLIVRLERNLNRLNQCCIALDEFTQLICRDKSMTLTSIAKRK